VTTTTCGFTAYNNNRRTSVCAGARSRVCTFGGRTLDLVTGDVIRGANPRGLPFICRRRPPVIPLKKRRRGTNTTHSPRHCTYIHTQPRKPEMGVLCDVRWVCVCVCFVGFTHFVKVYNRTRFPYTTNAGWLWCIYSNSVNGSVNRELTTIIYVYISIYPYDNMTCLLFTLQHTQISSCAVYSDSSYVRTYVTDIHIIIFACVYNNIIHGLYVFHWY